MTNAKHTPGPWRIFESLQSDCRQVKPTESDPGFIYWSRRIAGPADVQVADLTYYSTGGAGYPCASSVEEMLENANLIAAAPDLLAALEAIAPFIDSIVCYASTIDEYAGNKAAKMVVDALAKAKGEA